MEKPVKNQAVEKNPFNVRFFLDFAIVCFVSFGILYFLGLVPNELKINNSTHNSKTVSVGNITQVTTSNTILKKSGELPTRIVINAIGVDADVFNPLTTDVKTLDEYLLRGAVRYPGSGLLDDGNLFIFGHSTGYRVVNNQAYKTFNGLGKLKVGDEIIVYSATAKYIYNVTSVSMQIASDVKIDLSSTINRLTLTTCYSFGTKEDRYVVEADFTAKQ